MIKTCNNCLSRLKINNTSGFCSKCLKFIYKADKNISKLLYKDKKSTNINTYELNTPITQRMKGHTYNYRNSDEK